MQSGMVDIHKGIRQSCILSPELFNLYFEEAIRTLRMCDRIDLLGMNYNNLRYAHDTALIIDGEEKLQRTAKDLV